MKLTISLKVENQGKNKNIVRTDKVGGRRKKTATVAGCWTFWVKEAGLKVRVRWREGLQDFE